MIQKLNKASLKASTANQVVRISYTASTGSVTNPYAYVSGTTFTLSNPACIQPTSGATVQTGTATLVSKSRVDAASYDLTITTGAGEGPLLITDSFGNVAAIPVVADDTKHKETWRAGSFSTSLYSDAGASVASLPTPAPAINWNSPADNANTTVQVWTGMNGGTLTQSTQANRGSYVGGGMRAGVRFNDGNGVSGGTSYTSNITVNGRNVHIFMLMEKDATNSSNEQGQPQQIIPSLGINAYGLDTFGSSNNTGWLFYFQGNAAAASGSTKPRQQSNIGTWMWSSTNSTANRTRFAIDGKYDEIASNSGAGTSVANPAFGHATLGLSATVYQISVWDGELTVAAETAIAACMNFNYGITTTLTSPVPSYAKTLVCIGPSTMEGKPGNSNGWGIQKTFTTHSRGYKVHNLSCGYQMGSKADSDFTARYSAYYDSAGTIWFLHDLTLVDVSYSNVSVSSAIATLQSIVNKCKALGGKVVVSIPFNCVLLQGSGTWLNPFLIESIRTAMLAMTNVDAFVDLPRDKALGTLVAGLGAQMQGARGDLSSDQYGPHINALGNQFIGGRVLEVIQGIDVYAPAQYATDQAAVTAAKSGINDSVTVLGVMGTQSLAAVQSTAAATQYATDQAAVTAAANKILEGTTILGVAGTASADSGEGTMKTTTNSIADMSAGYWTNMPDVPITPSTGPVTLTLNPSSDSVLVRVYVSTNAGNSFMLWRDENAIGSDRLQAADNGPYPLAGGYATVFHFKPPDGTNAIRISLQPVANDVSNTDAWITA